ncbi:MAG: SDR family oxidoreductase [Caldilineaceae bacterium]|nr:SDR family oxidoreductase [Caldilineaceae bacterium]
MMTTQTLLVTGGSGHLGRRVLELLLDAKAGKLVTTTRTPEKLADLAARGVDVRKADFGDPSTLTTAFAGVDRLLLISLDVIGEQRQTQQHAAIAAAAAAGVKHVLYTSLPNPEPGNPAAVAPDHYATEQALAATALDWTILRDNLYMELLLGSLPATLGRGQWFSAGNGNKTAYITREDCARAAAAALAATTTGRQILTLTGPQALSDAEIAQIASEITGKPLQVNLVSAEEKSNALVGAGLPPFVANLLVSFETATAQGFLSEVSSAVTDLTGSAPQSVRDFLTANQAALVGA